MQPAQRRLAVLALLLGACISLFVALLAFTLAPGLTSHADAWFVGGVLGVALALFAERF